VSSHDVGSSGSLGSTHADPSSRQRFMANAHFRAQAGGAHHDECPGELHWGGRERIGPHKDVLEFFVVVESLKL